MQDTLPTVISQYANSPIILALLDSFNSAIDPINDINNFYNDVWNLDTAVGYGLDVWGRILGLPRTLVIPTPEFFGFEQPGGGGASGQEFNQGIFFHGQYYTEMPTVRLHDPQYRTALYAKAAANISDATIPGINKILRILFGLPSPIWGGPGIAYVIDNRNMTYQIMFGPPCSFNARVEVLGGVNTMTVASVISTPIGGVTPQILPGQVVAAANPADSAVWIPNTVVAQLTGTPGGIGTYQMQGSGIVGNLDVISHTTLPMLVTAILNAGIIPKPCGVAVTFAN